MRAVDTKILVRLVVRDNPQQTAAAIRFVEPGAWVPLFSLVEAIWVLESFYGLEPNQLATAIEMLLDHQQLVLQDSSIVAQALIAFREKPALGFSDCLILETARKSGHLPLGTFDRNLGKLAGAETL